MELNGRFCEIESVKSTGDDWTLDVKVLPDRPDAKTPEGFARELSAIMGWPMKKGLALVADKKNARAQVQFTPQKINEILGLQLSGAEIASFLKRVRVGTKESSNVWGAYIPADRTDLNLVEDLADEVMRLYGVDNIPSVALPALNLVPLPSVYEAAQKARAILVSLGYTEIYSYSFSAAGEREVEKSLASHKSFLRTNLSDALRETLLSHLDHALFETEAARVFEIGTVFFKDREELHLAAGIAYNKEKYKKESLPSWFPHTDWSQTSVICEMPLERLVSALAGEKCPDINSFVHLNTQFRSFSLYPRIIRDIALFVPSGVRAEDVESVIRENAGPLLAEGPVKFDEFSKAGESRTSLAFRIAFQSHKKTLSDAEANEALSSIISALEKHPNWEVRK